MPDTTKITLSPQERQLVTDPGWILTKRSVIDKVYRLLGDQSDRIGIHLRSSKDWLPTEVGNSEPKIYRGESYLELPYVMLDHPRCFKGDDAFAIRIFFWWGNFFSLTLQLSGAYKSTFEKPLLQHLQRLREENMYLCIADDPWQHHFEDSNYRSIESMSQSELNMEFQRKEFCKISVKFPIGRWDEMPELLEGALVLMLNALKP